MAIHDWLKRLERIPDGAPQVIPEADPLDAERGQPWFKHPVEIAESHSIFVNVFLWLIIGCVTGGGLTMLFVVVLLPIDIAWSQLGPHVLASPWKGLVSLIGFTLVAGGASFLFVMIPIALGTGSVPVFRRGVQITGSQIYGASTVPAAVALIVLAGLFSFLIAVSLVFSATRVDFGAAMDRWRGSLSLWGLLSHPFFDYTTLIFIELWVISAAISWSRDLAANMNSHRGLILEELQFTELLAEGILVSHLSDLHITADEWQKRTEPGLNANRPFLAILSERSIDLSSSDVILLSGDITDAGTAGDWKEFMHMLEGANTIDWRSKAVILPGNHDLNIDNPNTDNPLLHIRQGSRDMRKLRQIRFIYAMNQLQGNRSWILGEKNTLQRFSEYFAAILDSLERYRVHVPPNLNNGSVYALSRPQPTTSATLDMIALPDVAWNRIFPLMVEVQATRGTPWRVIVLDSNRKSSNAITNAFGQVSPEQLARLTQLIEVCERGNLPYLLAMHHHLGRRSFPDSQSIWSSLSERFMSIAHPQSFLKAIDRGVHTVLFHGHRHATINGSFRFGGSTVQVIGSSSTSLGDQASANADDRTAPGFCQWKLCSDLQSTWISDMKHLGLKRGKAVG
jgi:hypothetical protein